MLLREPAVQRRLDLRISLSNTISLRRRRFKFQRRSRLKLLSVQRQPPTYATIHRHYNSSRTPPLNLRVVVLRLDLKRYTSIHRRKSLLSKILSCRILTIQLTATLRLKGTTSKRKLLGHCGSFKKTRRWLCKIFSQCQTGSSELVYCLQFLGQKPCGKSIFL